MSHAIRSWSNALRSTFARKPLLNTEKRLCAYAKKTTHRLVQAYRPKFVKHPMCPRHFFLDRPWNLAHVFYEHLPRRWRFFCSPPDMLIFACFPEYLGLRSKFQVEKKIRQRLGRDSKNMCADNQNLSPKNGVNMSAFARRTCIICVVAL